ncbi:MAG TPA: sugar ABC transporter ATP-binding protein, partial [Clostridiaceae bacterium]|nr:sugar ABC transporter ATP-binding protein [Clostridiaceae bacterium]
QTIYEKPENMFVAGFIGSPQMNFTDAKIVKEGNNLFVTFGKEKLPIPADKAKVIEDAGYEGKEVVFGIRPEHMNDDAKFMEEHKDSTISAKIEVMEHMGPETFLYFVCEGTNMVARVEPTT